MNSQQSKHWKNEVLGQVLSAFARHPPLRAILIFKGARILNLRLGEELRQSLDIDSNLDISFTATHSSLVEQQAYLQHESMAALQHFFQRQDPIRYEVQSVRVEQKPADGMHPFGWTGFMVVANLGDRKHPGVRGLPRIELDVASPEQLSVRAVSELAVDDHTVLAYSLERIAGEKMRAFLSSLPAYIDKIGRRIDSRRVKDLYDLARIRRRHAITDMTFWLNAGEEFRAACQSRFIDCDGLATFSDGLAATRLLYDRDSALSHSIPFEEAWDTISQVVTFFERHQLVPFRVPLPTTV